MAQNSVQVQVRLINGSTVRNDFSETSTLSDVAQWLRDSKNVDGEFKIQNSYPRVAFGDEQMKSTLKSLGLLKQVTLILVRPGAQQASVTKNIGEKTFGDEAKNLFDNFLSLFKPNETKEPEKKEPPKPAQEKETEKPSDGQQQTSGQVITKKNIDGMSRANISGFQHS